MSQQVVLTIFAFLVGTTVLNFLIAVAARIYTGYRPYTHLIFYWTSLMVTYGAAAVLNQGPTEIGFALFPQFIPMYYLAKFLYDARGLNFPYRAWGVGVVVGTAASTAMLLSGTDFTLALLPVVVAGSWAILPPAWNTLVAARNQASWIEKATALITASAVVNHYNYAFFRMDATTQYWGWSISIAQYQSLSILLPLLLLQQREKRERGHLSSAIERLSGRAPELAPRVAAERLYTELELALSQKEAAVERLRLANLELDEKRSMNEILVKTMAHDLCNPLTVLASYISLLQEGKEGRLDVPSVLRKMEKSTKTATDIIWRIRHAMGASLNSVSLGVDELLDAVAEAEENHRSALELKGLKFVVKNRLPATTKTRGDRGALVEHVLANAISNAIKFSPRGGQIQVELAPAGDGGVRLSIMDQGIGLGGNESDFLVSRPGTEGEVGTGFGVLLMRFFASRMGGRITLASPSPLGVQEAPGTILSLELEAEAAQFTSIRKLSGGAEAPTV